ncbi:16S rRNA (uracil1498-N3)-methyltransferase [Litorivivens lipolytica]|uniref:Ribosomal RNA small subunit methyltransferase E n=1 Tax=Litorivivens lipolytica TaxID=1524264 RepID=A0A7W4W6M2_9GAMM|nr:16S rRNA (uracil(1498)-N(3))-methyltransferase [Litorivivens lipolytica]MBB3048400.1 16S rRNA (uracil1498-N3)-methyltransferase [Litorivivens lipolytica]
MRIPRIYTDQPLSKGAELQLDDSASRHLCQVLRLNRGDVLVLFNGDGCSYPARISHADKKKAQVTVEDCDQRALESPFPIHLGIALSKGDRFDWVLQKATELGVTAITPLQTQRVDVKLNRERAEKKQRHWQQVIISACEQCGRNRLPQLAEPQTLQDWLGEVEADQKWVLSPAHEGGLRPSQSASSAALLVGPEGGLEDDEVKLALNAGFEALQLGPRILRTETAPLAAISILQFCWGDFDQG